MNLQALFHSYDFDDLSLEHSTGFEQSIETASDDLIHWWLLDCGLTLEDIETRFEEGQDAREIANELIAQGYEFIS